MPSKVSVFAVRQTFRRLLSDDRGAILALVGLATTVLLGFAGLGVETGLWYAMKRQEQTAADYAALSGAMEIAAGKPYYQSASNSGICGLAKRDATGNGFTFTGGFACPNATPGCTSPGSGQMCANNPPVLGPKAGNVNYVEVVLGRQQNTLFASLFLPNVMIRSRAVAGVDLTGFTCTLALATSGSKAIDIAGNTTINMNQCGFASNSTDPDGVNLQGSAVLNAAWFQSAGNYNVNGNPTINVPTKLAYAAPVPDPYSTTCSPAIACASPIVWPAPGANATKFDASSWAGGTLQPGSYQAKKNSDPPLAFKSGTTTLCPGVYILDGESSQGHAFEVTGGTVQMGTAGSGGCPANGISGVTIIATSRAGTTGGGFYINGGTVILSAPTTSPQAGIPSGILFAQDPAHADVKANGNGKQADSTITAGGATALTGVLYTPKTNVTWTGNSNSSCFITIALTETFTGNSTMSGNINSCKAAGVTGPTVLTIALTE